MAIIDLNLLTRDYDSKNAEVFYAAIDTIEADEETIIMQFDGVRKTWVDENLNGDFNMAVGYEKVVPIYFHLRFDIAKLFLTKPEEFFAIEGTWVQLSVSDLKNGLPIYQYSYDSAENDELSRYLVKIEFLNSYSSLSNLLNTTFSLNHIKPSSESDIVQLLNSSGQVGVDDFVSVYNVGQGNLNAICDGQNVAQLYYDMGGGGFRNHFTYPTPLRICLSRNQPIVLSHWDMDHIETARRDIVRNGIASNFATVKWIAPNQTISPGYSKFATTLNATGNLLLWPAGLPQIQFNFGRIIKSNGPGKNHSGLVLEVNIPGSIAGFESILLPADSAYAYIPGIGQLYDGLVATHHGAEFDIHNNPVPVANGNHKICYSYGLNNSYRHPRPLAINAHQNARWSNAGDTIYGHFAFNAYIALPLPPPCINANCDLTIQQS